MASIEAYPIGSNGGTLVTIIAPPLPAGGPSPRLRVFVIDVSGSMSSPAIVQVAGGAREETGRTILDVVCDAAIAAIATLGPNDGAAIVSFSNAAVERMPVSIMTPEGKESARLVLRGLRPGGSTHLWDGIEKGMNVVREALEANKPMARCAMVDVLTDGLPNVEPPNMAGFVPSLRDYFEMHHFLPMVNFLGFGNNIQEDVLDELARESGGHFSFIPSPDMVATNFVNSAAAFGAAFATTPTLYYGVGQGSPGTQVPGLSLGLIPYGARVSFLVNLPAGTPRSSLLLLTGLNTGTAADRVFATERNADEHIMGAVCVQQWRKRLVDGLRNMRRVGQMGDLSEALALVRGLSEGIRAVPKEPLGAPAAAALSCLLGDVEGQVAICLSRTEYYKGWGSAYLLSLARAHELQLCANFKDPGLQGYATPVFTALQTTAGGLFRTALAAAMSAARPSSVSAAGGGGGGHSAPPPQPPARAAAAAALFDPAGGCVHGAGRVERYGGTECRADELRPGMRVLLASPPGKYGIVTHIVRTRVAPETPCVALSCGQGTLVVTAWHPVNFQGEWCFPANALDDFVVSKETASEYPSATYMYSWAVVGEEGSPMDGEYYGSVVDGIPIITLGHGITENSTLGDGITGHNVLIHPYYGTRKVLQDLERLHAWCANNGIDYNEFAVGEGQWRWNRDETTGEVSIEPCQPLSGSLGWIPME